MTSHKRATATAPPKNMTRLILIAILSQALSCQGFVTPITNLHRTSVARDNLATIRPNGIVRSLKMQLSESHRQELSLNKLHRRQSSITRMQSINRIIDWQQPMCEAEEAFRERVEAEQTQTVNVDAWVSEDKSDCVFSLDGESHGTLLYRLEGGMYRFKGYIVYPEAMSASDGDFAAFRGDFSSVKIVRPPLLNFDDPIPQCSASYLAAFARFFLTEFHIQEIKRVRDILLEPVHNDELPQIGDTVSLSHGYVTALEMRVTEEMTWEPTRFVSTHRTNQRDAAGANISRVINWSITAPGPECHDPVHQISSGVTLTAGKLRRLLQLQIGMTGEEHSELIAAGIAASYTGTSDTFNAAAKHAEVTLRRHVTDHLLNATARLRRTEGWHLLNRAIAAHARGASASSLGLKTWRRVLRAQE